MVVGIRRRKSCQHPAVFCPSPEDGIHTERGLAWKTLHMSRAKLKNSASTSTILCAFAMESMVELQVNVPTSCPSWLFSTFAVCTMLLIAVHILALVISNFILPNLDTIGRYRVVQLVTESPMGHMRGFVELAWSFSSVLGLFLFLVEIVLLCWVKFWDYTHVACWAGTIAVAPFIIAFVAFGIHFHRTLLSHSYEQRSQQLRRIELLNSQLDSIRVTY